MAKPPSVRAKLMSDETSPWRVGKQLLRYAYVATVRMRMPNLREGEEREEEEGWEGQLQVWLNGASWPKIGLTQPFPSQR